MSGADAVSSSRRTASDRALAQVVRDETGPIVAALARSFDDLDVAEEAVASAVEAALRAWRVDGIPPRPAAWLMTAARRDALDRVRRRRRLQEKIPLLSEPERSSSDSVDERVPLLFGCCHPAIAPEAQLALSLRAVLGLPTAQIARATFEQVPTVAQRISRAKRKIVASGVPLRIPQGAGRRSRLDLVLTMISVMYDAAYLRPGMDAAGDRDIADDALWLSDVVAGELDAEAEAHGLRALLLFHRSRESARAVDGELVPLPQQDRRLWDRAMMARAHASLDRAARLRRPGRWQIQAAIAACHADAGAAADTDWPQILVLYDMLLTHERSAFVRLNRAVALAEVAGPRSALAELDDLRLDGLHLWNALRADMLRRDGCPAQAGEADRRARELATNEAERRLLSQRLAR